MLVAFSFQEGYQVVGLEGDRPICIRLARQKHSRKTIHRKTGAAASGRTPVKQVRAAQGLEPLGADSCPALTGNLDETKKAGPQ